jgi:PhoPQ-activated pathogenicity-related protein
MYLDGADADWLALLPMVKSAVRAMDTVQTVAFDKKHVTVNDFVVTGVSKRGWTTWLTAAVDDRVCAIAPCVINVLNMDEQMKYHKKVYEGVTAGTVGGYSEAVHDYVDEGVFDDMDSPRFQSMLGVIDPYEYRDRLTMPKLMINSTGDEFFVPDSCQFFLDNLPGENYVRYQPNLGHDVVSGQTTLKQFYKAVLNGTDLPDFSWTVKPDGSIHMTTEDVPTAVKLWQATNPSTRDFRQSFAAPFWTSSTLAADEPGVYVASVPEPATGYTAFMIEMTYTVGGEAMTFTTEVNVVPGVVLPGDANFDDMVDDRDASIVGSHWQLQSDATWGMGDFNRDGKVNDADAAIMAANWTGSAEGAESSVPEPGTLVLLVIGGIVVLCGRRRRTK